MNEPEMVRDPPTDYTIHYAAYLANGATFLLLFKDDDPLDTTFFDGDGMLHSTRQIVSMCPPFETTNT